MLLAAVGFAALTVPLQTLVSDPHGLNTLKYQRLKTAAMEEHWHVGDECERVPLVLFALSDEQAGRNDYEIAIPHLGSLILIQSLDRMFDPLTSAPAGERSPMVPVFFVFRIWAC